MKKEHVETRITLHFTWTAQDINNLLREQVRERLRVKHSLDDVRIVVYSPGIHPFPQTIIGGAQNIVASADVEIVQKGEKPDDTP